MSKFAERFIEKGFRKGLEEAEQQGIRKGEEAVLLHQLECKYGAAAAAAYRERIQLADSDMLVEWAMRVLTAETIEEVFH